MKVKGYWVSFDTDGDHGRGRIIYFEVWGQYLRDDGSFGGNFSVCRYFVQDYKKGGDPVAEAEQYANEHAKRLNESLKVTGPDPMRYKRREDMPPETRRYSIDELLGEEGKRP